MNETESLAGRIREWEKLLNTSKPLLTELPQIGESHSQLTEVVEDVKAHADREQTLRGQAAMSVARRRVLENAARAIKAKLVAGIRGHFGTQDERLLEFGIPIGKVGRRTKASKAADIVASAEPAPDVPAAVPASLGG